MLGDPTHTVANNLPLIILAIGEEGNKSEKNLCSLLNKDGTLVKTKYNVSLLKPYLESDEVEYIRDENTPTKNTNPLTSTDDKASAKKR